MLKQFPNFILRSDVFTLTARSVLVFGLGVAVLLTASLAWADQIVLKDGDRITGEIIKKDRQTVTMRSKNFGTVTLKWDDIATVSTDQPLNVVLANNEGPIKANLQTQDGRIQIAAPAGPQNVAPADIVALRDDTEEKAYERLLHPGPL